MSSRPTRSLRNHWLLVFLVAVVAALVPPAAAQATAGSGGSRDHPALTVMTRNLYLGTGLTNLITAATLPEFVAAVTQDWANVVATDFPTRARALAEEIRRAEPDVVSLQEVSLWRDQTPSDILDPTGNPIGSPTPNATHVVYDYLKILRAQLAARGIPYVPVSTSVNADAESPRAASGGGFTDVRLTDRDVILVRAPLAGKFRHPAAGHYAAQLTIPAVAGPVTFTRGWASIDYRAAGRTTVRIFDTHLEVEDPAAAAAVQEAQAAEFLGLVAASPYPVVALGDFNSAADGSTTLTYKLLTHVLTDAWLAAHPHDPGVTCCQSELLDNRTSTAAQRIDLVLTTGPWSVEKADRTGSVPFRTSRPPFWATDHFGAAVELELGR
jgi:endonuclease/exonuclease/phosphatase family metal-dependent hydrolase